ncbi:hypothetical protein LCGC14_0854960 [marine sediment metagenome]|uniref:Uncharacterized protein n=1 Tax=marine sediment metagenome TaxID=412755 RepID=A0A0F9P965_9ZZZZ
MEFVIKVKKIGEPDSQSWEEKYDKDVEDPNDYGRNIVAYFNATLNSYEKPREFISSRIIKK